MPKEKVKKPQRPVTRLQVSRWERERRRNRFIRVTVITVIVITGLIIALGFYLTEIKPWQQVVIKVNDTQINMSYFVKMLRMNGAGQDSRYDDYIVDQVTSQIQENEIFRQEAGKSELSLADEDVDKYLQGVFKEENQDTENKDSDWRQKYLKALKNLRVTEAEHRRMVIEPLLYSLKIQDNIVEPQVPEESEQVHCEGILLENKDKSDEVKSRLEAGEEFSKLVEEYSKDEESKGKKGDLGWLTRGIIGDTFDGVAFSLKTGDLSQPIENVPGVAEGQVWVIRVIEKSDKRPIEEDQRQVLISDAFYEWLNNKMNEARLWSYRELGSKEVRKVSSWALSHLK